MAKRRPPSDTELPAERPERPRRLQAIEDGVLKLVFAVLLVGTAVVLGADARPGIEAARESLPETLSPLRTGPIPMPPPTPGDQVRRYSPTGVPALPGDGPGALPGHVGPPGADALVQAMEFRRGTEGRASAVGRIDVGTAAAFDDFLNTQGDELTVLVLHSPGGSVRDAIAMSRALRKKGIATEVPTNGYCASSCPLVFAGGVRRTVGEPAWLGVHQVFTVGDETGTVSDGLAGGQRISAEVLALLVDMDIDAAAWIPAMRTRKDELYVYTRKELEAFGWVAEGEETEAAAAGG
ncbi:hypothetical protein AB7M35_003312 [Amorphus suaedae]